MLSRFLSECAELKAPVQKQKSKDCSSYRKQEETKMSVTGNKTLSTLEVCISNRIFIYIDKCMYLCVYYRLYVYMNVYIYKYVYVDKISVYVYAYLCIYYMYIHPYFLYGLKGNGGSTKESL